MFKIYVGNISYKTSERIIEKLFATYGHVDEVIFVRDDDSSEFRGFGFVLMYDDTQGRTAIAELNGRQVNGRALSVTEAGKKKPKLVKKPPEEASADRPQRRVVRGARAGAAGNRRPFRRHRGQ